MFAPTSQSMEKNIVCMEIHMKIVLHDKQISITLQIYVKQDCCGSNPISNKSH